MSDLGVIDRFLNVFTTYIDSGFGLLGREVSYLSATLVVIDVTLAGLMWAMGGADDPIARLLKKVLYVGAFAFIITNFNALSNIIFRSFAGLGLTASRTPLSAAELLQPGRLAKVGVDAAAPIMTQIGDLMGFPEIFLHLDVALVLFLAWVVVIVSFFVLAVQLFVILIEFKLTTLAGFVLVPFALWNRTAFLAERVLGNVVSSGVKVLVLAIIVGIGTTIFGEFGRAVTGDPSLDQALAVMLASLALLGLGIFGPGIANGLVAGAPQLGGGAAAGTAIAATGLAVAGTAAAAGASRLVGRGITAVRSVSATGAGAASGGIARAHTVASTTTAASTSATSKGPGSATPSAPSTGADGLSPTAGRDQTNATNDNASSEPIDTPPAWARTLRRRQAFTHGIASAAQALRAGDHGSSGAAPKLGDDDRSAS